MKIVYFSVTGNVKRFSLSLNPNYFQVIEGNSNLIIDEPILLITSTVGYGQIPQEVVQFCENNHNNLQYVIASGNRNWGQMFAYSGEVISENYKIKLLYKFELSGTKKDIDNVNTILKKIHRGELCTQQ